jgi:hypothetical protein
VACRIAVAGALEAGECLICAVDLAWAVLQSAAAAVLALVERFLVVAAAAYLEQAPVGESPEAVLSQDRRSLRESGCPVKQ